MHLIVTESRFAVLLTLEFVLCGSLEQKQVPVSF